MGGVDRQGSEARGSRSGLTAHGYGRRARHLPIAADVVDPEVEVGGVGIVGVPAERGLPDLTRIDPLGRPGVLRRPAHRMSDASWAAVDCFNGSSRRRHSPLNRRHSSNVSAHVLGLEGRAVEGGTEAMV